MGKQYGQLDLFSSVHETKKDAQCRIDEKIKIDYMTCQKRAAERLRLGTEQKGKWPW